MSGLVLFGWIAAVVGSAGAVPQLVRLVRARTSAGLSLLQWQLVLAVCASWVPHGFRAHAWNMVAGNLLMVAGAIIILLLILRDRHLNPLAVFWLPAALIAVLVTLDFTWALAFGLLISASQLVGAVAQFLDLLRCVDIRGVSIAYLCYTLLVNILWFIWGLWAKDTAIQIAASSLATVVLLTIIWWVLRRTGSVHPLGGRPADATSEGGLVAEGIPILSD